MCSVRKGLLRNFVKFTGKHLCQSLFFKKVAGQETWAQVFSCEFCKISKNTFFAEHLWATTFENFLELLVNSSSNTVKKFNFMSASPVLIKNVIILLYNTLLKCLALVHVFRVGFQNLLCRLFLKKSCCLTGKMEVQKISISNCFFN